MYVKLFGGPLDGETESIMDGCDGIRLKYPRYAWKLAEGEVQTQHYYRRSSEDPKYFVYEGPTE